jgi:hypothetical protein
MNLQDLLTKKIGLHYTDYPCSLDGVRVFAATELDITTEPKLLKISKYLYTVKLVDREVSIRRLSITKDSEVATAAYYEWLATRVSMEEEGVFGNN